MKEFLSNLAGIFAEHQVLQCWAQCRHSTTVPGVVCAEKTLRDGSNEISLTQKESLSLNYDLHIFILLQFVFEFHIAELPENFGVCCFLHPC